MMRRNLAALALGSGLAVPASAQHGTWTDSYVSRLQALSLMQTLNAELLGSRSATLTLERWCGERAMAATPRVVAEPVTGPPVPPTPEQRARLRVADSVTVGYRRVRLSCGGRTLSVAENWYVPGRLTPEMNRLLETTDTPFGRAIQPLSPERRTISATLLWTPLPAGWQGGPEPSHPCRWSGPLDPPPALFEHRALVVSGEGLPLAEVREVYQREILGAPVPGPC
jgi:chorismate-pyruvate lyase